MEFTVSPRVLADPPLRRCSGLAFRLFINAACHADAIGLFIATPGYLADEIMHGDFPRSDVVAAFAELAKEGAILCTQWKDSMVAAFPHWAEWTGNAIDDGRRWGPQERSELAPRDFSNNPRWMFKATAAMRKRRFPKTPIEPIMAAYRGTLLEAGFAALRPSSREHHEELIRERWRDHPQLAWFETYFAVVLEQQDGMSPKRRSLSYILRSDVIGKVMRGGYAQEETQNVQAGKRTD